MKKQNTKQQIEELETFLICDMPNKIFPMDRKLGKTMFRTDYFETPKQVEKYLTAHFNILKRQLKKDSAKRGVK